MYTIQVTNLSEFTQRFKDKEEKIKENLQVGIHEGGLLLKEEIEASIGGNRSEPRSVDTGAFLNSIEMDEIFNGVTLTSPLSYPRYLEYGTFRIFPRRHFGNSMDRTFPLIKEKVQEQIHEAVQ